MSKSPKAVDRRKFTSSRESIRELMINTTLNFTEQPTIRTPSNGKTMMSKTCLNIKARMEEEKPVLVSKLNPEEGEGYAARENSVEYEGTGLENTPRFKKISSIKTYHKRLTNPILQPPA